jgi:hypothetical protein
MPSPFPGMDPYLEGPLWMSVHSQLTAEIARQLAPKLRPKYLALTTERFVLDEVSDISVVTTSPYPDWPSRVPHVVVEVRETATRRLVTAIEVLSPTDKRAEGREEYLSKRRRILLSTAHLLEIDLLRQGQRVPMQQPLPKAPYFVILSRAEERPITAVWPIQFADRLPVVPVPLLPGDADVPLDLQQALTNVYDLLGYDLAIDYSRPPEIALPPDAVAWAEQRVRDATGGASSRPG